MKARPRVEIVPSGGGSLWGALAAAAVVAYVAAPPAWRRRVNAAAAQLVREALTPAPPSGDLSRKYPKAIDV